LRNISPPQIVQGEEQLGRFLGLNDKISYVVTNSTIQ
jgi:hypothetical protein